MKTPSPTYFSAKLITRIKRVNIIGVLGVTLKKMDKKRCLNVERKSKCVCLYPKDKLNVN